MSVLSHLTEEILQERDELREHLRTFYWFFMMVECGGPDGTEADEAVYDDAHNSLMAVRKLIGEDDDAPL